METVKIDTGFTIAKFYWPSVPTAESYTLWVEGDKGRICCIEFDSEGLTTFFLSPSRDGESYHQSATSGFVFEVDGLEPGTKYSYFITAKDASGKVLKEDKGTFTTKILDGIENVNHPQTSKRKYLQDGQIFIQKGNKTYTLTGQEVR